MAGMTEFNPTRLDIARKRRGLTKTRLAEMAGISTRIITAYEHGEKEPSQTTVATLADMLGFPTGFFYGPDLETPPVEGVSFRALTSMSARQRDQALGAAALATELADWIRERFDLPTPEVPRLPHVDPETAAEHVRATWGLGQRSAPNMVHLLEAHGVRVFSLAAENAEVDAFSFWRDRVPYVFLNTMKSAERSRMDAAHELGHLVMHWDGGPQGREPEQQAQRFGSAFLMPRASVLAEAPRGARLNQIITAKRRWKVSAASLAYRMHAVGLLTEWQYRSAFIQISQRGYRSDEPYGIPRETSQLLAKVFQALRATGQTQADVAHQLAISSDELNALIFGLVLTPVAGDHQPEATARDIQPPLHLVTHADRETSDPTRNLRHVHTFDPTGDPMAAQRRHVTKRPDGNWQDKAEGAQRAGSLHPTQAAAEAAAKEVLRNRPSGGEVIVHRPDGTIRDSDTINRPDPNPPRDTRH
jgi:Zn-dependent peptidase ImmA (M78 family)/DNA-binding XRE family transcriptional regulator